MYFRVLTRVTCNSRDKHTQLFCSLVTVQMPGNTINEPHLLTLILMGLSRYLKIFRLLPVKVLRLALLIVVHSFMGAVLAQSPPPSIQGVLLDADTLQVISQGTVSIISNDLEPTSAEPDVNGVFRFRAIPEGVYPVSYTHLTLPTILLV